MYSFHSHSVLWLITRNIFTNIEEQAIVGCLKFILLEIPPIHECDFFWITEINELEGVFCWIITSEGSATTETSDDSAEHTDQRVDWSDSGKISRVYGGISF